MVDKYISAMAIREASMGSSFTNDEEPIPLCLSDIYSAQRCISEYIRHTPIEQSSSLSQYCKCNLAFKFEALQKTGSFKVRGVLNKLISLTMNEKENGVVCASAGNHSAAVAYASHKLGIKSTIYMPNFVAPNRIDYAKKYSNVIIYGETMEECESKAKEYAKENHMKYISSYNDLEILAGYATIGLDILKDFNDVDVIIVPIGTGTLLAGIACLAKSLRPELKIYGVQSKSNDSGVEKKDIALEDCDRIRHKCKNTVGIIEKFVDDIFVVEPEDVSKAMLLLLERTKVVSEGTGAVGLAAIIKGIIPNIKEDTNVCCVVTGGNIDMLSINHIIQRGLEAQTRIKKITITAPDSTTQMQQIVNICCEQKATVIECKRERRGNVLGYCDFYITLELSGNSHLEKLTKALNDNGYTIKDN